MTDNIIITIARPSFLFIIIIIIIIIIFLIIIIIIVVVVVVVVVVVTKPNKEETARSIFEETAINITTEGRKHLGAALGSSYYLEQYVNGKVEEWVG